MVQRKESDQISEYKKQEYIDGFSTICGISRAKAQIILAKHDFNVIPAFDDFEHDRYFLNNFCCCLLNILVIFGKLFTFIRQGKQLPGY